MTLEFVMALTAMIGTAGMFVLNVIKESRKKKSDDIVESAESIRAKAEAKLGSVEAAERVIAMYGEVVKDLNTRLKHLEESNVHLEEANRYLQQQIVGLQKEITRLRELLRTYRNESY